VPSSGPSANPPARAPTSAAAPPPSARPFPFDGDWKGTFGCDQPSRFERQEALTVRKGDIWFQSQTAGSPRRFLLLGAISSDGRATLRGDGVDAANKPYETTFDVTFAGNRLTGRGRTSTGFSCYLDMQRQ
jgi:hypothetical protein